MDKPFIIAYYLPQFHPIPENDEWWGKGFTEWTNVAKAKPLFRGHYQPKIPADLGFYDLRVPEVREQQAELAREAGVDGFCYWHYWFGNGKELLERPFKEVVESGKPNFPFCLGWANESWESKIWNAEGHKTKQILIEQQYPGEKDSTNHFYSLINAFKDPRYIRIQGAPLFLIYKPELHPDIKKFMDTWNLLIRKEGIAEHFFFVGTCSDTTYDSILRMGFNAQTVHLGERMRAAYKDRSVFYRKIHDFFRTLFHRPLIISYKQCIKHLWNPSIDRKESTIPTLLSNWDHSPRSKNQALVIHDCTPELFEKHCNEIFSNIANKKNKLLFLKSWNEWGEGNYMEPDLKFGKARIKALKKAKINSFEK
ncbi:glycoside hydrolase family 99-like domain-containing protein [Fibrobacter sp. UWEL]|uniref:glycosyltransferase WbsX family protein n=1 Tax=Fibrobacter sp. UWEL TaxID=1896209 RepID=UPI000920D307|nr:glycoside hydrolase family 99-like domain-containing protein [Fibrobacter sp. UWEL]SHL48557.1 Glycosyltransferase WbsX [Fibrobacter sp. UWEL]